MERSSNLSECITREIISKAKKCELCSFTSTYPRGLEKHKKSVHYKTKDHGCDLCSYRTKLAKHVVRHKKAVHFNVRDNICDQCNYKSSSKGCLKAHKRAVHDKIKDHLCDMCDYKSSERTKITRHKKAVHFRIRDNECDQCELKFSTKEQLQRHQRVKHPLTKATLRKIQSSAEEKFSNDNDYSTSTHQSVKNSNRTNRITTDDNIIEETNIVKIENEMTSTSMIRNDERAETQELKNCCSETAARLLRDLASAEESYPQLLRELRDENAKLIRDLAAAEERYQVERRMREELEDDIYISTG